MQKIRLTASYFGRVFRRIKSRYPKSLLDSLLSDKVLNTLSTRWGKENETRAVDENEQLTSLRTEKCGLYINPRCCWLGASPYRIVSDEKENSPGLVEIKCPYSARNMTIIRVCRAEVIMCNTEGRKAASEENTQVSGQIGITGRLWCDFVLLTTKGIDYERIYFDKTQWKSCVASLILVH